MATPSDIDADLARKLFTYNAKTGALFWRVDRLGSNGRKVVNAGDSAGWLEPGGYRRVQVGKHKILAHRIIWVWVHGAIPPGSQIDHRNTNRADNRLDNLRVASQSQNQANSTKKASNSSGFKGVCFKRAAGKWGASCTVNRKQRHIGYFNTPEEAHAAYVAYAEKVHGEFANDGNS